MRRPDRVGATVLVAIAVMLSIMGLGAGAAWTLRQGSTRIHHGSLVMRRADQLARAAVAEAVDTIQRLANDPHATPLVVPGGAAGLIVDAWFRAVRPPPAGGTPPVADTVEIVCAATTALAMADGFELLSESGKGGVVARCVAAKTHQGVHQGVIELTIDIRGGRGPWIVGRRLVERRVFYVTSTDISAEGDACAESADDPNCALSYTCRVLAAPLGRVHANFAI